MQRLRIIPWVLGVAVVLTTLVGANRLLHPTDPATGAPAASTPEPLSTEGLVAKGTVESDPPVVAYSLPAHLPAGTIVDVSVINGQSVKVGDPLLRYDDTILQKDKAKADLGYNTAVQDYNNAAAKLKVHATEIELRNLAIKAAIDQVARAKEAQDLAKRAFNKTYNALSRDPSKPEDRAKEESEDERVVFARAKLDEAENGLRKATLELQLAQESRASLEAITSQAAYHAELVKKDVEKAKQAIDDCTLKAKAAGTIERVTAAVGQTVYPQSRPLLYLVPSGKRIVVAEIVPDFAYKISGRVGQIGEISDDSHTTLKYAGKVVRISDAFLPKPGAATLLDGKTNAVLNIEIEVTDATPAGKPPLRVGQPVRVSFP